MDSDLKRVWKLAASGNGEALAALRDDAISAALLPDTGISEGDELLAEAEIFARLAALNGKVMDLIEVCGLLFIRSARHQDRGNRLAEDAADAMEARDDAKADQFSRLALQELQRAEAFQEQALELFQPITHHEDAAGVILLAQYLSDAADAGNEVAAARLNQLFDSVTKERAAMLAGAVRQQEVVN